MLIKPMDYTDKTLAEVVRGLLEETRLSETDVAERAGKEISQGYINDIKNSRVLAEGVSIGKMKALARGFGVPEEFFFNVARGVNSRTPVLQQQINDYIFSLSKSRQEDLLEIAKMYFAAENKARTETENPNGKMLAPKSKNKIPLYKGSKKEDRKKVV